MFDEYIELIYKNKLIISKLIDKHFTDNLKWCGWYEQADELRNLTKKQYTIIN